MRALKDLYVLVPVNGWKLQELVRGESVGEAAVGREPIEFLGFRNSNVCPVLQLACTKVVE